MEYESDPEMLIVISNQNPDAILVLGRGKEVSELTCPPVIRFKEESQMLNPVPPMRRVIVDGIDVYPREDLTILPCNTPADDLEKLGLDLDRQPIVHVNLPIVTGKQIGRAHV